jgi:hypothetical protein
MAKRQTTSKPRRLTVRMYRDILGDCFLIRAPKGDGTANILIDCGILQGMPGAADRAVRIMKNIETETGGRLDVLIVTHEHWDHLSGFAQAEDVFARIEVGELWLAWTEDRRDELAQTLAAGRSRALAVVELSHAAAMAMADHTSPEADPEAEAMDMKPRKFGFSELLAFYGLSPEEDGSALAATGKKKRATTGSILEALRAHAKSVRYFRPGVDPVPVAGLDDLRAFVLGPPRDEAWLKRSTPRKGTGEVYQLAAGGDDDLFYLAALGAAGLDDAAEREPDMVLPFGRRRLLAFDAPATGVDRDEREARRRFAAVYDRPEDEWRRVDQDWLLAGEQLALKLDNDTNNTSLAIAFEIGRGKDARVMLFPGDAQVGNWLSWGELAWTEKGEDGADRRIGIEDLLARTVLYKVGHHCSHNATPRERGLELMTSPDLVAMVPVVASFANDAAKHWNMPFPSLLARLEEKTGRRVIRADRSVADFQGIATKHADQPAELDRKTWDRFLAAVEEISDAEGPLAIDYALET